MTPIQALENLDKAASTVSGTREIHVLLQQSVDVLREALLSRAGGSPNQEPPVKD